MDTPVIRIVSQTGIYVTFALYLFWTLRHGPRAWIPFVGTVFYAILFEHFNMLRYAHMVGGYYYHANSWLFLWHDVPLYIPLAWAFIVATSQSLSDRLNLSEWSKPFSDALFALLIDLSLDVVAIRLNFWYWRGVGRNDAFFGVPADNFLGWLLVTFTFSLLSRAYLRHTDARPHSLGAGIAIQWLVIPIAAYGLYLGIEWIVHQAYRLCGAQSLRSQLYILSGVAALFVAAAAVGSRDARTAPRNGNESAPQTQEAPTRRRSLFAIHAPRHIFHIFAIVGLLCIPVAARNPALWAISMGVWLTEWIITRKAGSRP